MSAGAGEHVFGYASLIADMHREGEELAVLKGYRRRWNVATDNRRTLPGYKLYLDPKTGERPHVYVTFVNLVADETSAVAGVLFPVSADALALLDLRERNYDRREVTAQLVDPPVSGRVWAYFGKPEAEARHREGVASGRAVVNSRYFDRVREGFARVGADALAAYDASTDPPGIPLVELERVEVE